MLLNYSDQELQVYLLKIMTPVYHYVSCRLKLASLWQECKSIWDVNLYHWQTRLCI